MADEDITLDGKPLQSLRVADLKAALEQRNLSKSGQKNTLIKRLKGALMLENLQKSSSSHSGLQPNSQIGEEMSQNSFIQQYLAKQQELLRQRLEREAQQDEDADDSPAVTEEDEDHSEDNDNPPHVSDKQWPVHSQPSMTRAEQKGDPVMSHGVVGTAVEIPGSKMQRATFYQGHKEPPAPSPPRAIASLSVRVLGQPPAIPRTHVKEGAAPSEPGSAHPILHLSRSAGDHANEDSNEDSEDDDSDDDEDWGPGPGGARKGNRAPPKPQQMPPSVPPTFARSKRKLQPPQHIPPPQAHHSPMQLRHPTPPPSPPPDLFPLPDTPKQSPPDADGLDEGPGACGPRAAPFPPTTMQRQESDSSSRSSSPEPPVKRRPGPLSLLVQKMESEGAFHSKVDCSAVNLSVETVQSSAESASSSKSPPQYMGRTNIQENQDMEEMKQLEDSKKQQRKRKEQETEKKRLPEDKEQQRKEQENESKYQEEEKEEVKKCQDEQTRKEKKSQKVTETASVDKNAVTEARYSESSSDSDSKSVSSSSSSESSSSSSQDKTYPASQLKKSENGQDIQEDKKTNQSKGAEKCDLSQREVSEPNTPAMTEVETESESSMVPEPPSGTEPEKSEGCLEEVPMPLPLSLTVPAAYYYHHQHLLHFSSYLSYKSCPDMPKCVVGTRIRPRICNQMALSKA